MPNEFIRPEEFARRLHESIIEQVKKISPDVPDQEDELNPSQFEMYKSVLEGVSRPMFYGRSPLGD